MEQPLTPPRSSAKKIIWGQGALFGVIIGVLLLIFSFLPLDNSIATPINLVIWLVGFFLIGMYASRQTGRVGTGALTGLVAGLVTGVVNLLGGIIQIAINAPRFNQAIQAVLDQTRRSGQNIDFSTARSFAIGALIVTFILALVLELGLGAGIGAIGGVFGKKQAKVPPPPPYQESMYQSPQ